MKTIGLIGGMSWESTVEYYQLINKLVNEQLGGLHSASCILFSVDFAEIESYQANGEWDKAGEVLANIAVKLDQAGADFIVICTNTMHKVVEIIEEQINIPILHIADATASVIKKQRLERIGLLGTKYTMEQDFYRARIEQNGMKIIVPDEEDREMVNKVIFDELCLGHIRDSSKRYYIEVIHRLIAKGAEGIILGCTEIGMLIKQEDIRVPLFDTTAIHAFEAVRLALKKE